MADRDDLEQVRAALRESARVDDGRVQLDVEDGVLVLRGSVPDATQATVAEMVAADHVDRVRSELRVDAGLREGRSEPLASEPATPVETEILIADVDMLAGADAETTSDLGRALEENEPWDPPTEPSLAPTQAEYGEHVAMGAGGDIEGDEETDAPEDLAPSAPDLSHHDLVEAAEGVQAPAQDPEAVAPPEQPQPDPVGRDGFGQSPPEEPEPFPERVPGAEPGVGATGAGTIGDGGVAGEPAPETGATGADTAPADPVRAGMGGSRNDSGPARGPQAREDPPLREDFPDPD